MSLRDGLKNLRASREEEKETIPTEPKTAAPLEPEKPTSEKRETFSTRIRPSVRYALKRQLLELQEQGHKVRMEDVLEALILRYVGNAEFRAEVLAEIDT
ncbi:hypothetical protein [Deinococcus radiopugnans]|uniref:Uncharacterized protein n=1 Tax=Deinococcus radiopugnans ATCC 19172 TaxID=585398 RepID=A0A5C4Y584_9DEIO|nr:hypothetical protein [Deinococcus radiopugnans]MBB6017067.1 hypothetical protein [Deinococcus radiopugnans ATCC 19172]TNM70699.1 hypothetical protein FHR04_12425 [Deinococcus radiopugnans ATCC 19172]